MYSEYAYDSMYLVSTKGDVFSKYTGRHLKHSKGAQGYPVVNVRNSKGVRVPVPIHRMVAITHIPPVEGKTFVNHKDGNKWNNCISNLEWCTNRENISHAVKNGWNTKGDSHGNSSLTEEQVHLVCELLQEGLSGGKVIEIFNGRGEYLPRAVVYNIRSRRDWTHISKDYSWPKRNTANKRSKRATTIPKGSTPK